MKGRKRGKTMLATSTPELKRLRLEQEERQAKKHGKISVSAKCKKTLFEAKHAGKKERLPSISERFESKKKGEKKKECSKNLPLERVKERPRSATNQRAKVMKKI
jgi:hypothetical protein